MQSIEYICPYCKKSILIEDIKNNFNLCLHCDRDLSKAKEFTPIRDKEFKKELNLEKWNLNLEKWNDVNKAGFCFMSSFIMGLIGSLLAWNGIGPYQLWMGIGIGAILFYFIGIIYMITYIEK